MFRRGFVLENLLAVILVVLLVCVVLISFVPGIRDSLREFSSEVSRIAREVFKGEIEVDVKRSEGYKRAKEIFEKIKKCKDFKGGFKEDCKCLREEEIALNKGEDIVVYALHTGGLGFYFSSRFGEFAPLGDIRDFGKGCVIEDKSKYNALRIGDGKYFFSSGEVMKIKEIVGFYNRKGELCFSFDEVMKVCGKELMVYERCILKPADKSGERAYNVDCDGDGKNWFICDKNYGGGCTLTRYERCYLDRERFDIERYKLRGYTGFKDEEVCVQGVWREPDSGEKYCKIVGGMWVDGVKKWDKRYSKFIENFGSVNVKYVDDYNGDISDGFCCGDDKANTKYERYIEYKEGYLSEIQIELKEVRTRDGACCLVDKEKGGYCVFDGKCYSTNEKREEGDYYCWNGVWLLEKDFNKIKV